MAAMPATGSGTRVRTSRDRRPNGQLRPGPGRWDWRPWGRRGARVGPRRDSVSVACLRWPVPGRPSVDTTLDCMERAAVVRRVTGDGRGLQRDVGVARCDSPPLAPLLNRTD